MSTTVTPEQSKNSTLLSFKGEKNGILDFTIESVNVSFINGIRRVILSDIPTLVFIVFHMIKMTLTFILTLQD